MNYQSFQEKVLSANFDNFEDIAMQIFQFQANHNPIYQDYLKYLKVAPHKIQSIYQIPFLPIELFKSHVVLCKGFVAERIFASSGTTGIQTSQHHIVDSEFYIEISKKIFEQTYQSLSDYHLLALLPSYLERNNSSLVFMVENFMNLTLSPSGFYLNNFEQLHKDLLELKRQNKKILLIGVTFGLLDFAEQYPDDYEGVIVMETGGMKGRRKEMIREEVHEYLCKQMNVSEIHSEYGMTELLSQFYAKKDGVFQPNPFAKVLLREPNDPFSLQNNSKSGGINLIDLANIHSCSFLETKDLGKILPNGAFQVMGRFDNSDVRGCNLMVS
jgi:phenylacetate-coenzyme A ligase PaaK-like adenylate-forming protein